MRGGLRSNPPLLGNSNKTTVVIELDRKTAETHIDWATPLRQPARSARYGLDNGRDGIG